MPAQSETNTQSRPQSVVFVFLLSIVQMTVLFSSWNVCTQTMQFRIESIMSRFDFDLITENKGIPAPIFLTLCTVQDYQLIAGRSTHHSILRFNFKQEFIED